MVQYRFELGTGEGLVRVSSAFISDGQWHEIRLERDGNTARVVVDRKHVAQGSSPGINDILNTQSDVIFLGAEVCQFIYFFARKYYDFGFSLQRVYPSVRRILSARVSHRPTDVVFHKKRFGKFKIEIQIFSGRARLL